MKCSSLMKFVVVFSGITILSFLLPIRPVVAQEKSQGDPKSTIKLKIVNDKNGAVTVLDTAFTVDKVLGQEDMDQILRDMKVNMEMELDALAKNREEMHVNLELEIRDSLLSDSLGREIERVVVLSPERKIYRTKGPREFRFNFPCIPDFHGSPDGPADFEWNQGFPFDGEQIRKYIEQQKTFSDIVGDIPLERIKSYSIKDRKGGKRIIIDVEDCPVIRGQERIIYRDFPSSRMPRKTQKGPGEI